MNKAFFLLLLIFSFQTGFSQGTPPPPPTTPPPPGLPIDGGLVVLFFLALTSGYYLLQKYKLYKKGSL